MASVNTETIRCSKSFKIKVNRLRGKMRTSEFLDRLDLYSRDVKLDEVSDRLERIESALGAILEVEIERSPGGTEFAGLNELVELYGKIYPGDVEDSVAFWQYRSRLMRKYLDDRLGDGNQVYTCKERAILKYAELFKQILFVDRRWEADLFEVVNQQDLMSLDVEFVTLAMRYVWLLENAGLIDYEDLETHSFEFIELERKVSKENEKPASEVRSRV